MIESRGDILSYTLAFEPRAFHCRVNSLPLSRFYADAIVCFIVRYIILILGRCFARRVYAAADDAMMKIFLAAYYAIRRAHTAARTSSRHVFFSDAFVSRTTLFMKTHTARL